MSERLVISKPLYFTEAKNHCGYCSGNKDNEEDYYCLDSWYQQHTNHDEGANDSVVENCTVGFQAHLMSVEMYDKLCNMGYRRSGKFIYKADLLRNCCRLYTIRTTPDQVSMSKEFKTTLRRFSKRVLPCDKVLHKNTKEGRNFIDEIIETESLSESFKTRFEPAVFTEQKYELFAKYQEHVHNDFKHNPKSFKRFLCDSPFSKETLLGAKEEWEQLNNWKALKKTDKLKRLGPVHECYYFEGKMIAIAVTDILPSGLSSVYFIWDPDYYKWSLGKLSALREVSFLEKANLEYYYMGYYLDDCPKMNYKAKYGGELLDVCTHKFISLKRLSELKRPGKLFAIDDSCRSGNKAKHLGELTLNNQLTQAATKIDQRATVHNVAEEIYGINGKAFSEGNEAALALAHMGIPYEVNEHPFRLNNEDKDQNGIFDIPNVVPGLVPLKEILQMIMSDAVSVLQGTVTFFDMYNGDMRNLESFEEEPPELKKALCDVVRVIGLNNTRGLLLIC